MVAKTVSTVVSMFPVSLRRWWMLSTRHAKVTRSWPRHWRGGEHGIRGIRGGMEDVNESEVTRTGNGNAEFESFGGRREGWSWEDSWIRDQPWPRRLRPVGHLTALGTMRSYQHRYRNYNIHTTWPFRHEMDTT
ncbi:predicted protein [Histoplasma capsulatum var. duboisii H88]|nr:predicted protein [Histoplasma capsulatum var. duboisii H88]